MNSIPLPRTARQLVVVSAAFLIASLLISGINAYVAFASPPLAPYVSDKVGFEGQLTDSSGNPVADGNYTITFSLYSQATGGTSLWTETQTVAVSKGLYAVQLGSITSLPTTAFDGARWLGVKVGSDSEMSPRVPVSAVPFALNARQAQGLQGYSVSSNAPATNNALIWDGSAWTPRGATFPDLSAVGNNVNPQTFLASYRSGAILSYVDANTVKVSAGEVMVNGYMRRNTADVNVGFTAGGLNLGLDTGTAQSNTTYYVYAVADNTSTSSFELIVSASSSAPSGKTNFRKLGWFSTEPSSTQIGQTGNVVSSAPRHNPIGVDTTATTISNSTTETTVFSTGIPGGTLSSGNILHLRIWFDAVNSTGQNRTATVRVKLGSTTMQTYSHTLFPETGAGFMDIGLYGGGSTSSQKSSGLIVYGDQNGGSQLILANVNPGSASLDSTTDLVFTVTVQLGYAHANFTYNVRAAYLTGPYQP